jgi:hypothetical protein
VRARGARGECGYGDGSKATAKVTPLHFDLILVLSNRPKVRDILGSGFNCLTLYDGVLNAALDLVPLKAEDSRD